MTLLRIFLPFFCFLAAVVLSFLKMSFPTYWILPVLTVMLPGVGFVVWIYISKDMFLKFLSSPEIKMRSKSIINVALALFILLGLAIISSNKKFNVSLDLTRSGSHTLTNNSKKALLALMNKHRDFKVIGFFSNALVSKNFIRLLAKYQKINDFDLNIFDSDIDLLEAKKFNITKRNAAIFMANGQRVSIHVFNEQEITKALISLFRNEKRTIYLLSGHGEASINTSDPMGLDRIKEYLEQFRYDIKILPLAERGAIPRDADLVVSVGSKYNHTFVEVKAIQNYISAGGNFLVFQDALYPVDSINKITSIAGIRFAPSLVILPRDHSLTKVMGQDTALMNWFSPTHQITASFSEEKKMVLRGKNIRTLDLSLKQGWSFEELVKTSNDNIVIEDVFTVEDLVDVSKNQMKNKVATTVAVSEHKIIGGKVVAVGGSSMIRNQGSNKEFDFKFVGNIFHYFFKQNELMSISGEKKKGGKIQITSRSSMYALMGLCGLYPLLILLITFAVWVRRMEK